MLLAVVRHEAQWQILLTRRADSLRHHAGQIALAGGRRDAQDPNLTATALRETAEETGIEASALASFPAAARLLHPLGLRRCTRCPRSCRKSPSPAQCRRRWPKSFTCRSIFALHTADYSKPRLHPQRPHAHHAHAALWALRRLGPHRHDYLCKTWPRRYHLFQSGRLKAWQKSSYSGMQEKVIQNYAL